MVPQKQVSIILRVIVVILLGILSTAHGYAATPSLADIAYGNDARQRLDVYLPEAANKAPVILMVHGGAWRIGNKSNAGVSDAKSTHYTQHGYIFVSTNYRLSEVSPVDQASDVAKAMAFVRANAARWGGDPSRIILMGHSAGAHLAALVAANPAYWGLTPWRATISLDSAALDVEQLMQHEARRLHRRAFGDDPALWRAASPMAQLSQQATPFLLICSLERAHACEQSKAFAQKVEEYGISVTYMPVKMSHREINHAVGNEGDYTKAIDRFIAQHL